jgi:hypothetical protein
VRCTVCDIKGYFLLPDDFWNNRLRLPLDITASDCSVNKYTEEQWSQLEALGVVFMPRSLLRGTSGTFDADMFIWTSSVVNSERAMSGSAYMSSLRELKYFGLSVRLIKDIK